MEFGSDIYIYYIDSGQQDKHKNRSIIALSANGRISKVNLHNPSYNEPNELKYYVIDHRTCNVYNDRNVIQTPNYPNSEGIIPSLQQTKKCGSNDLRLQYQVVLSPPELVPMI